MCVPGCMETVRRRLSRRDFFRVAGASTVVAAGVAARPAPLFAQSGGISRVVDLTHTLGEDFPTFFGVPGISVNQKFAIADDGFNLNTWELNEHTGTHLDAPMHFSSGDQDSADEIDIGTLVVPLAVLDVRAKAAENPDYEVRPEDIAGWEAQHGELPAKAAVAMNSGWAAHVGSDRFRNADEDGVMHFPGFHEEAAQMLMERDASGIAVDTLSLDHGASQDFATHYLWLPSNRWGVEALANLDQVPASGATIVVGAPKVKGATGGPSRIIALVG